MYLRPKSLLSLAVLSLAAVIADVGGAPSVQAQIKDGEYGLYQPCGLVGWAFATSDHSKEYWAYIDGAYDYADSSNNSSANRWRLDAQFVGCGPYASYAAFKSAVLARPEAQGHAIAFQNHSVTEEVIQN